MPYIKVDIDKIKAFQQEFSNIDRKVTSISSSFLSVSYKVDSDIKNSNGIERKLQNISNDFSVHSKALQKINSFLGDASTAYYNVEKNLFGQYTIDNISAEDMDVLLTEISGATGVSKTVLAEDLRKGLSEFNKKFDLASKGLSGVSKVVTYILSKADYAVNLNTGKLIVSGFKRNGILNGLVKIFNKGKGIGGSYRADTFADTALGKLNIFGDKLAKVAKGVSVAADVIEAGVHAFDDVMDASGKIKDIWADNTKSQHDKVCETTAVGITSAAAVALDVAAPFVGSAVAAAIPIPGVNLLAGAAVTKGMQIMSEVVTSEAVVGAVSSGVKAISEAGQKVLESKNVGEAALNTLNLVGTTVAAGVKTCITVQVETVKTVVNKVADTGKKVVNWIKSW